MNCTPDLRAFAPLLPSVSATRYALLSENDAPKKTKLTFT